MQQAHCGPDVLTRRLALPGLKMCPASMTLAGSLALSYLCHWLRLAPAECNARDEHTPLHRAPPWSAWRGLAGRAGAGPGRAGEGNVGTVPGQQPILSPWIADPV